MLATNKGVTVSAAEAMIYNALTRVKGMAVDAQSVTFSVWMADAGYDDFYAFSTILLGLVERGIVLREDWVYYLPGTAKAIQLQEEDLPDAHFIALVSATNPKEASGYIVERHGTPLPVNAVLIPEALQGVKVESPIALLLATGK